MPPTGLGSEHDEQSRFFAYLTHINHPAVACTFAIPNGFLQTKAMRVRACREGVRKGVLDTFTAYPVPHYAGLFMELKVKGNKLTKEQKAFLELMRKVGYRAEVVHSAEEMLQTWADYLGFEVSISR